MNPRGKGGAYAPIPGDDEHQGDEDPENSRAPGAAAPDPASMGSPPLFFHHPASYADAAGSSLHQRGEPRTPGGMASRARPVLDEVVD